MTDQIVTPTEEKPKRAPRAAKTAEPEKPTSIIAIIPLIREKLGAVAKDQTASAGARYAYRGHDQIVNAIAPLFNEYGIFTTVEDTLLEYEGRNSGNKFVTAGVLAKKVTFHAPDGSSVSSTIVAESQDFGNKAVGQASTYAYRIALTQTFTIPTGEPDMEESNPEYEATHSAPAAPVPTQPQAAAPSTEDITALQVEIGELFAGAGVAKEEIRPRITKYFKGREGWDTNVTALTRVRDALKRGEDVGGSDE